VTAREEGIARVQMQTNALLLTPERACALRAAGLTSAFVAYHSHLPEIQDRLTGRKDSGARTLAGIKAAIRAGIPVSLNPVLTRLNVSHFPDFIDHLAAELGPLGHGRVPLEVVCVTLMQPHGRAAQNPALLPSYREAQPAIAEAVQRARGHGIATDTHYASLPLCLLGDDAAIQASLEFRECRALRQGPPGAFLEERLQAVIAHKVQGPPCTRCVHKNFCHGVWRAYAKRAASARSGRGAARWPTGSEEQRRWTDTRSSSK
jgi:MoaA/NifB/PqqE/SkfB family radical SAM enzyme